mmetsp:Transcript_32275/g.47055  ORF Transcript_32275/g.47055 Transcript_32275/m.47055 type:complete len:673 (+) Transcript_32275:100-2118(+)
MPKARMAMRDDNAATTAAAATDKASNEITRVGRKAMLIPPLIFALWVLTDDKTTRDSTDMIHHLAAMTALHRHPPCLRVYRALLEIILGLFCTSFSLRVWESTQGLKDGSIIGFLLFRPPPDKEKELGMKDGHCYNDDDDYVPVSALDDYEESIEGGDGGGGGGGDDEVPISACDAAGRRSGMEDDDVVDDFPISPPTQSFSLNNSNDLSPFKPPTSTSVMGASIDLLLVTLVSLFLFTISSAEGGRYIDNIHNYQQQKQQQEEQRGGVFQRLADIAAPIFPLVLYLFVATVLLLPWKKRGNFWNIVSLTVMAPYHDVTFRDGFIGDILTSTVRPLQDIAFTAFYLLSGLQGWWSKSYGIDDAAVPVERSWLLHTAVLPACMISPLWWRFLQNLRQAYDAKKRWPYLGNALKYFVAAEVALFGLFDPSKKQTFVWMASFFFATLYQVWWDVFMDWELLVWRDDLPPSSSKIRWPFALRSQRLYQWKMTYYFIFVINFLLRFCWTLSFIPMRYLSQSGLLVNHFQSDLHILAGPAIASAEIIRRTLWGLLRVEFEAIKTLNANEKDARSNIPNAEAPTESLSLKQSKELNDIMDIRDEQDQPWDLKPMSIECARQGRQSAMASLTSSLRASGGTIMQSDMSSSSDIQILSELCLYATAFTSLGIIAAAHRQVM